VGETEEAAVEPLEATTTPSGAAGRTRLATEAAQQDDGTWKVWLAGLGITGVGATKVEAATDFGNQLQDAARKDPAVLAAMSPVAPPPAASAANVPPEYAALPSITAAEFDEVVASETPVLVDFWASWCRPCLAMAPSVVALQQEMGDRLRVVKVDVQTETELARKCSIAGVPSLLLYRAGEQLHRITGARGLDALRSEISPLLV
jgi:thioredoxin 1